MGEIEIEIEIEIERNITSIKRKRIAIKREEEIMDGQIEKVEKEKI